MIGIVDSEIRIVAADNSVKDYCKNRLTLSNPDYEKKRRMGMWVGSTPKTIKFYYTDGDDYIVPFGCLKDMVQIIGKSNFEIRLPKHNTIEGWGNSVPLYDYQQEAVDNMIKAHYGILQSKAGSGKGLPLDAIVYTPNGAKKNGDLQLGDEVCNTYGGVSRVTGIYDKGIVDCYEVTFSDGNKIICDKDHLWTVNYCRRWYKDGKRWVTQSVEELYEYGVKNSKGELNFEIPISDRVLFKQQEIPIHPWVLGAYLGDGYTCGNTVSFSNSEPDVINKFNDKCSGVLVYKGKYDYYVRDTGVMKKHLNDLGLLNKKSYEKFIPSNYLYNNDYVREQVLIGLIDTDGEVRKSDIRFTTTSHQLALDVKFLVESLGGTCNISERVTHYTYKGEYKEGRVSYRLGIKVPFEPFSSEKHISNYTPRTKYNIYRRITSIVKVEARQTRCITVDSEDHLYLTDNFIVTHNTQMGIAMAQKIGKKCLWITHTLDLLNQSKARAEQYMPKNTLGVIASGKVAIGSHITFATVQTLSKLNLNEFRYMWDCIIVDECHRCCSTVNEATMFGKVLNSLAARHKYGLSATVHRADGLIQGCFALLGNVAYRVPDEAIADKVMEVEVNTIYTGTKLTYEYLNFDGTIKWNRLIDCLVDNKERNELIVDNLENRPTLILSCRLEHLERLRGLLPRDKLDKSAFISGKMNTKKGKIEREQAIEDMRTGKKQYLFATYQLAKEGLDIPRLERLLLTTPEKDYAVIVQSIGRVARVCEGKDKPYVLDFVDDVKTLYRKYKERCRIYKKENVKINE